MWEGNGRPPLLVSQVKMPCSTRNNANNVNDARGHQLGSVAFGRRGNKASSVVNQRKPCNLENEDEDKTPLRIGTWNVRTMLRPGKLANVISEMKRRKINILGLSEVRWKENGDFTSEGKRIIYVGGSESQRGVAVLLDEETAKCVISTEVHEDRIVMVRIQAQPTNIVVIQVNMPTSTHSDEEVDVVSEKLEQISQNVKGREYLIVMGDWNAVIGEQREETCVGEFDLGRRNDRGQRLIEFCKQLKMVVTNTCFKQEKRRRYTWKAPGDTERYQLDYIMVAKI